MSLRAESPIDGALLGEVPEDDARVLEAKIESSARAFEAWRHVAVEERAAHLTALAERLRERREELSLLATMEMGKLFGEALAEVEKCAWVCEHYAQVGPAALAPRPVETDAARSFVRHDPLGPVLAVMPWNFPLWQVFRFAAPGLLAGNTGLLKHASNVPGCALVIEELFRSAGFPDGVFTTLMIGSAQVEKVLRDDRVAAVTLTGSEPAGRAVARIAGDVIKPSLLELGGSDPFVVLADADLEAALEGAATGRLINAGQSCIAAKRFLVERPHYDAFVAGLAERFGKLVVGDPREEGTQIGPMARPDLVTELHDQVERSLAAGARLVTGGSPIEGPGAYYRPTVLADVTPKMPAFREETFGPVAAVTVAESADEALALANLSPFGLGASIWTTPERGIALAPEIHSGHVSVNGIVKSDPRLPFGGVKRSGYGRELALEGLYSFVNVKSVWVGGS